MRLVHFYSISFTILLVATTVIGADQYVHLVERDHVHAFASAPFDQKTVGSALQRAALAQPDLLLLYGSSEVPSTGIFSSYPTGFDVFRVGGPGSSCLIYLQSIAGMGEELRGKEIVISMSPYQFYIKPGIRPEYYAGNFSRLHAYEFVFSMDLSVTLKRDAARRMLEFPSTLETDPLLKASLEELAEDSPVSLAAYYAILPLGRLQILAMDLEDDWETLDFIRRQPAIDSTIRTPSSPDWRKLINQAARQSEQAANNNAFGFENEWWDANKADALPLKQTETDDKFRARMAVAKEWTDLELLLRELRELGAKPLVLSTPMPGTFYDYMGISGLGRNAYYDKLEGMATAYGAAVIDFREHDSDKYFLSDRYSHPSQKGAVYYQEALDSFFHGKALAILNESLIR